MADRYFSNSGSDSGAGTVGDPWANPNAKESTISAGDNWYLNKGDTFSGGVSVSNSGSSGNKWTWNAYGSGDLPRISTLSTANGNWSSHATNVYKRTYSNTARRVFIGTDTDSLGRKASSAGNVSASRGWYQSGSTLYVYYTGSQAALNNEIVEIWRTSSGTAATFSCSHFTINDIWFSGGRNNHCVRLSGNRSGVVFDGGKFSRFCEPCFAGPCACRHADDPNSCPKTGVAMQVNSDGTILKNLTSTFDQGPGENFNGNFTENIRIGANNVTLENVTLVGGAHGILDSKNSNNLLVDRCTISAPNSDDGHGHAIGDTTRTPWTMRWMNMFEWPVKNHTYGDSVYIYGSVFRDQIGLGPGTNQQNGDRAFNIDSIIDNGTMYADDITLFNNVIARCGIGFYTRAWSGRNINRLVLKNNIFWHNNTNPSPNKDSLARDNLHIQIAVSPSGANFVDCQIKNNVLYAKNGQSNVIYYNRRQYTVSSIITQSTSGISWDNTRNYNESVPFTNDPGTSGTDFTISSWNRTGTNVGNNYKDPNGNLYTSNPNGDYPIGQYVYGSLPPNPDPPDPPTPNPDYPRPEDFLAWTGDTANIDDVDKRNTFITMPSSNVDIQATYSALADDGTEYIEKWKQHIVTIANSSWTESNVFDVPLTANYTHTDTSTIVSGVLGYYAGADQWQIRFMPHLTGAWTYETVSSNSTLNGVTGGFTCIHSDLPGELEASGDDWKLSDSGRTVAPMQLSSRKYFRRTATDDGISNFIDWAKNTCGALLIGQTLVYFSHAQSEKVYVTGEEGDEFHLPVWNRLNTHFDYLRDQGMGHYIMFYSDDDESPSSNGIAAGSARETRLFKYAIARFSAYPMVIWDTGIDSWEYRTESWMEDFCEYFLNNDPWQHPVGNRHTPGEANHDYQPDAATFYSDGDAGDGGGGEPTRSEFLSARASRSIPTLYADRFREDFRRGNWDRHSLRRVAWRSGLSGSLGIYIGGNSDSGYLDSDYATDLDVAEELGYRNTFFEDNVVDYASLDYNSDSLVTSGSAICASQTDVEAIAFLQNGGTISLNLGTWSGTFNVDWYDTRSGNTTTGNDVQGGDTVSFTSPTSGNNQDWILHVKNNNTYTLAVTDGDGDGSYLNTGYVNIIADEVASSVQPTPDPITSGIVDDADAQYAETGSGWGYVGTSGPISPGSATVRTYDDVNAVAFGHTTASGHMVVSIATRYPSGTSVDLTNNVTIDSVNANVGLQQLNIGGVTSTYIGLFYLDGVSVGSSTVNITFPTSMSEVVCAAYDVSNMADKAPEVTTTQIDTNGSTISDSLTTLTDDSICIDICAHQAGNTTFNPGVGQTEIYDDEATEKLASASSYIIKATAGSQTMSQTMANSSRLNYGIAAFAPAVGESADAYLNTARFKASGAGANTATWTFANVASGTRLQVDFWYPTVTGAATNTPVALSGIVTANTTIDQTANTGAWINVFNEVGAFDTGDLVVTMTDNANGSVVADAVRITVTQQYVARNPKAKTLMARRR